MYIFSWKKFFIRLQPNQFPLCVLVSFCPTSWFSNVALASSWVEKMKTDLYQLIDAVKQDTFSIVYDPFTTGNMHGYVYQKEERNFSWHSMWKISRAFCNPWQESQSGFFIWHQHETAKTTTFLPGFLWLLSQETWAFMADFTSRWAKIALNLGTLLYFPKV